MRACPSLRLCMTPALRVLNLSKNYFMSRKQAERGVENCAFAWAEYGKTVRALTLAESIAARNQQSAMRIPLPSPELPGIVFQPPATAPESSRQSMKIAYEAQRFVAEATA